MILMWALASLVFSSQACNFHWKVSGRGVLQSLVMCTFKLRRHEVLPRWLLGRKKTVLGLSMWSALLRDMWLDYPRAQWKKMGNHVAMSNCRGNESERLCLVWSWSHICCSYDRGWHYNYWSYYYRSIANCCTYD